MQGREWEKAWATWRLGGTKEAETDDDSACHSQEAALHPGGKGEPFEYFKQGNDMVGAVL